MKVFAYSYSNPLFESVPDVAIWGQAVDEMYQDLGGYSNGETASHRHQLEKLLQDCQNEPVAYVLVRRLAELGDSVEAVSDRLQIFETLGITVIALEDADQKGQWMRRSEALQLVQALQQNQQSQRIREGHARNRVKALPPPGKAPYGYRRGKERYTLDRTTAPVVKDFFEHFLLYGSLRGSVRYLQKKYNKKISASTGKRWLTSPVYRGDLAYQTGEIMPDTHPAILSRQEAAQVDRLLRRNSRMAPKTASAPRSLAGLVTCADCQSPMTISKVTATRKTQEYLYLRSVSCPNKPKCRAIPYEQVLDQTIQRICEDLPRAVAELQVPSMDGMKQGLAAQIAAKQAVLQQLPELTTTGILDAETAELRAYKVRSEIAQLQSTLAQLPPVDLKATAQTVSIPEFWLDLSETERRFYFREFIRQIELVRDGKKWALELVFIF
ncbi:recombinase family protein [Oscillatoria sp. FACHB-1407]|uniref:recombinase family protein n=1 Tax=Oscillatoria sp. FACHB-1407 TaxID=2692847 RepID=UPI0016830A83|nr:recombinase family protein [Oscillatoria sp. FACHB-1407]MBD2461885.1 recombinase family protein [Oscillatoria sp. FACHB-1407]